MSYKILIVEDNALLVETLEDFLSEHGFCSKTALCLKEAFQISYEKTFDIYLLDIKLPDGSGFELLKELRRSGDVTPAIFLTSSGEKESIQTGFTLGADDYIKKPFDLEELLWRIKAVLARAKGSNTHAWLLIDGIYKLDTARKRLYEGEKELDMHLKDIELLELLVQNRGLVVTKEMICSKLWACSEEINEGSIRVYINNLKKIFGKESITNIRSIGYRFEV